LLLLPFRAERWRDLIPQLELKRPNRRVSIITAAFHQSCMGDAATLAVLPMLVFPAKGYVMDSQHDDRFLVFVRTDVAHAATPEINEEEVAICASYQDARCVKRAFHLTAQECIIRYKGSTGGGD
jgi:hypothetical protein